MNLSEQNRLKYALFSLRVSIFVVLLMWTLDKFINPAHALGIFDNFYSISFLNEVGLYGVAAAEMVLIVLFVLGLYKRFSYGVVLVIHGISTISSYKQYFSPFEGPHLLFFAAIPMLAACWALYLMRGDDVFMAIH